MWEVVYRTVSGWRRFEEPFQTRAEAERCRSRLERTHIGFTWDVRCA